MKRGTVVWVNLSPTIGHEQQGLRPCVVLNDDKLKADQRFPTYCIVPLTKTPMSGDLYPTVHRGSSGLTHDSSALCDHVRSIDPLRIRSALGNVSPSDLTSIEHSVRTFLGL